MREILFRGKRTDNGEWVEGNLVLSPNADEGYQAIVIPCYYNYMYTSDYNNDVGFETWYKVEPETVGQFTGFKDCNGKKICEQDIVYEGCNGFVSVVEWCDKLGTYRLKGLGEDYVIKEAEIEWEVIGNIHDNPELLKGEE